MQEAQAWAHVRPHPHIVRFYDAWMEPAAKPEGAEHCFIWLEKCGETVGQRVRCGGDPFTEPELLELLKQVTSAHPPVVGAGYLTGRYGRPVLRVLASRCEALRPCVPAILLKLSTHSSFSRLLQRLEESSVSCSPRSFKAFAKIVNKLRV